MVFLVKTSRTKILPLQLIPKPNSSDDVSLDNAIQCLTSEEEQGQKRPQISSKRGKREIENSIRYFVRDQNYGILLGIRITVFCQGSELRYSVRDQNYGILLGIRITVFSQGQVTQKDDTRGQPKRVTQCFITQKSMAYRDTAYLKKTPHHKIYIYLMYYHNTQQL